MDVKAPLRRFDRFQQRHRLLAAPLGVVKKFGDDEGGSMVSLIAYRAFFSLFPLLLLMTTILGYLLADDPSLREKVVESTLSQFPVIGDQLKGGSLTGSGVALAVGIVGSLLAGLGVVLETEQSFDPVWGVPDDEQHGFLGSRLRAIGLLLFLGGLAIASTIVSGLVAGGSDLFGPVWGLLIATALNLVVFAAVFRLLTASGRVPRPGPRHRHRHGRLGAPAAGRRLVRLARGPQRDPGLRHLRPGHRPARLDPPRRLLHRARRRGQRGPRAPPLAAQFAARRPRGNPSVDKGRLVGPISSGFSPGLAPVPARMRRPTVSPR